MGQLIIPKTYIENPGHPVIFLAGPIRGAPNWQDKAALYLFSQNPELTIISPRREIRPKIQKYIASGNEDYFPRQRRWERHYLDIAAKKGAIMFWLPGEEEHNCKKCYGAMTREELGLVLGWYKYDKSIRFCIGSDGNFSELKTLRDDVEAYAPEKQIQETLESTCLEALRIAR